MPRVSKHNPVANGQKLGLVCRACGCQHFRVVYLRRLAGAILRRRECRHCGKRVMTRESAE